MVKGFKKALSLVLAMICAFGAMPMIAGVFAFAADEIVYDSISITPASVSLYVGDTEQLAAAGAYTVDGKAQSVALSKGVVWASENTEIVSVSNTGVITAVSLPADTLTKTVNVNAYYTSGDETLTASCKVTVKIAPVQVSSVAWKFTNADGATINSIIEGKEYSFKDKYTILPSNATDKTVEVTCEPELALEIDNEKQTFKVNDKIDDGIVRVTIKTKDGSNLANTMTLKVYSKKELEVKGVRWTWTGRDTTSETTLLNYKDGNNVATYPYEYEKDGIIERKYKLDPVYAADADAVTIEFKSSDKRVAYFDTDKKLLVPKGNGYCEITIIVTNEKGDEFKDKMGVVVKGAPYTPVTEVEMTSKDADGKFTFVKEISCYYTDTVDFGYNLKNDKKYSTDVDSKLYDSKGNLLDGCEVTWKSSDENVVVIDENGKATCKGSGTATITLIIEDNGETFEASCKFNGKIRWWQWLLKVLFGWIANLF